MSIETRTPDNNICPICDFHLISPTTYFNDENTKKNVYGIHCFRCSQFIIEDLALSDISSYFSTIEQKAYLSGWIREQNNPTILQDNLSQLSQLTPPTDEERTAKLLIHFSREYPHRGDKIAKIYIEKSIAELLTPPDEGYSGEMYQYYGKLAPIISVSWSVSWEEVNYLLMDYLTEEKEFFDSEILSKNGKIKISPKGWTYLENYNKGKYSNSVFIALKYEEDLLEYFRNYISNAVEDAGYQAIIIYDKSHTNIIDDEMKVEIKRSRFIISDLTNNSRGAYYEAGYAHGLGLPAIFTCNKNYFEKPPTDSDKIHFDTNHYPIHLWEFGEENGETFREYLKYLILSDERLGEGNYFKR
ncbi:MAG: hypothetical protein IIB45_06535 [Candidatus Marinimicrobia bacterium]|nr:hypothetical protein [Candidatus Neomarinimicrobiota bacterium]